MQLDTPLGGQNSPHHSSKSVAGMSKEGIGEGTTLDKTCHQNQVNLRMDARHLSTDGETPLENDQNTRYLNMEQSRWPFSQKESMHPGSYLVPRNFYAGTSQVSPIIDDMHNETCGALEKVSIDR